MKFFTNISSLGLEGDTATPNSVIDAMPYRSALVVPSSVFTNPAWNFPDGRYTLEIISVTGARAIISLYGKTSTEADYRMFLNNENNYPSGEWTKIISNADLARQVVSFSYHANIEHQAGVSYASGNILYISECIQVNTAVSANANILTNVKRGGTTINAPYTYGIIFQNGNAYSCNLEGSTVKTETALETGYAFIILVTALP